MSDEDTLDRRVSKWLETQGYPLEFRVAEAFRPTGQVTQSDYYSDPETGEPREIDVLVTSSRYTSNGISRIHFAIECKTSHDKPWVLLASPHRRLAGPARVAQRAASLRGRRALAVLAQESNVQQLPLFKVGRRPAHGLTQAFTTGIDVPYQALLAASKAATAISGRYDGSPSGRDFIAVAFPVIVLDGHLFEAFLSESNGLSVTEVDRGVLLSRNPIVGMPHTIVHVVTERAIAGFVQDVLGSAPELLRRLADAIPVEEPAALPNDEP